MRGRLVVAAALALATPAAAQERPPEGDLFGAPAPQEVAPPPQAAPPEAPPLSRDDLLLAKPDEAAALSQDAAPENPLQIGGLFYLRTQTTSQEDQSPDTWSLSSPFLADAYFDARPNDRVRGFMLGRLSFDPTLPTSVPAETTTTTTTGGVGSNSTGTTLSGLTSRRLRGPTVALDQLWLRFDIDRTVFVTAGKQHVRWGTARFWAPTDFLHQVRRNPLDPFDPRVGTTMVKFHFPWEARGWNFYAIAVTEQGGATSTLGDLGGAARAEVVLGAAELGVDAIAQASQRPRLGLDVSMGLGDFDVYGDVGWRSGKDMQRVRYEPNPALGTDPTGMPYTSPVQAFPTIEKAVDAYFPVSRESGMKPQAVAGLTYSRQYADNDVFTVGAEYFYNTLGYDDPAAYAGLILPRTEPLTDRPSFFYLGRHYAALFAVLAAPGSWNDTTFTLSTLSNASDQSFISRLDYAVTVLTHLRFEAFAAVHYGRNEGEFRLGVKQLSLGGASPFSRSPSFLDLGIALRLEI